MKRQFLLFVIAVSVMTTSCSVFKNTPKKVDVTKLVPLTQALINEYHITPITLKKYQYFTGPEAIILEKEDSVKSASVGPGGKMILSNTDKILIAPYTPAVCLRIDNAGKMVFTFSNISANFLVFGPSSKDEDGTYVMFTLPDNQVKYGKELRTVTSGDGSNIYLDPKQIPKFRIEPGRRVN